MAKTSSSKNGTATKIAPVPSSSELDGIVISDDERAEIAKLEGEALRFKVVLADLDMQVARLQMALPEARQKVAESSQAYFDAVMKAAEAHGIDLNDKATKWNFDTSKMVFTRQA